MLLKELGEFGLIERIKRSIKLDHSVVVGTGDDCAVVKYSKDKFELLTCDMIVEGVDFTSKDDPELFGRKALAVSISDIAACGGIPRHALVALGLPKKSKVELVDKILKGMLSLANKFNINIVGGDISASEKIIIDVSMSGLVEKKNLVLRSGAKAGDMIFVTGKLGGSIRGKHLTFTPRLKESKYLVENFKINAMIDISDGMMQDLNHILKQSKVGALIPIKSIPLEKVAWSINEALYMGEDFELLFTMPAREGSKLLKKSREFTCIGAVIDKKFGLIIIDKYDKPKNIKIKGFNHF